MLQNAKGFTIDLLDYLGSQAQVSFTSCSRWYTLHCMFKHSQCMCCQCSSIKTEVLMARGSHSVFSLSNDIHWWPEKVIVYFLSQSFHFSTLSWPEKVIVCFLSQYLHSLMALRKQDVQAMGNKERLNNVQMALEALRNVIRNNPGMNLHYNVYRCTEPLHPVCDIDGVFPLILYVDDISSKFSSMFLTTPRDQHFKKTSSTP